MRKYIIVFLLLFFPSVSGATNTLLLIGDSITCSLKNRHFWDAADAFPPYGYDVVKIDPGIVQYSGSGISKWKKGGGVLSDGAEYNAVIAAAPTHISILLGQNDLDSGAALSSLSDDYETFWKDLRSDLPGVQIFVFLSHPCYTQKLGNLGQGSGEYSSIGLRCKNPNLELFNAMLKSKLEANVIPYCSIWDRVIAQYGYNYTDNFVTKYLGMDLSTTYNYLEDGVHPKAQGVDSGYYFDYILPAWQNWLEGGTTRISGGVGFYGGAELQ